MKGTLRLYDCDPAYRCDRDLEVFPCGGSVLLETRDISIREDHALIELDRSGIQLLVQFLQAWLAETVDGEKS